MTAKTTSPEAIMGDTLAGRLRAFGQRGVLVQMAQRGQIIELRCEMPKFVDIGARLGLTRERIRQVESQALLLLQDTQD